MGRNGNNGGNGGGNNRGGNNRGGGNGGANRGGNGGGNGAGSKTCSICNRPGHIAEKCFNNPNSANYKGNGNQNQNSGGNNNHANNKGRNNNGGNNSGDNSNGSPQPSRPCKHCNEQGHWDSSCPNLGNGNQNQIQIQYQNQSQNQNQNQNQNGKRGLRPCRNCGDMHMDRDCPQNNGGNRNQGNDNRNNNQPRALFHNGQEPALDRPCHHCQGNHYSNKCPNNGSNQNSGYVNQHFTQGNAQMYQSAVNAPWGNPRSSSNFDDFDDFDEEYSLSDTPQGFQNNNNPQQQQQFQNQGFQTQYSPQQFQYQGQQQMQQVWGAYPDSYYITQRPTFYRDGAQGCRREAVLDRDGDVIMLDGWQCSSSSNGAYCRIEEPLHRPLW
jgi:hypothetical protein